LAKLTEEKALLKLEIARLQRQMMVSSQRQQQQTQQGQQQQQQQHTLLGQQRQKQTQPETRDRIRKQPCRVDFNPATEVAMPCLSIAHEMLDEPNRGAINKDDRKKIVGHISQSNQSTVDTSPGMDLSTDAGSSVPCSSDDGSELGDGVMTTLMMQNIPNEYSRQMLLDLLNGNGFAGKYDFAYLPLDFKTKRSLGYAFLNFTSKEVATQFLNAFEGFSGWCIPSRKVCAVTWSALQGLEAHVECYRSSPVMHSSVPEECRPLLFESGQKIPFPEPKKKIREPRAWNRGRH
jgi:hypothetical protein